MARKNTLEMYSSLKEQLEDHRMESQTETEADAVVVLNIIRMKGQNGLVTVF